MLPLSERPGARRRKLEQSACNVAGLWGQESSSCDRMGKEAVSVSPGNKLARAGSTQVLGKQGRFSVSHTTFVYFLCVSPGFSHGFLKTPKVN